MECRQRPFLSRPAISQLPIEKEGVLENMTDRLIGRVKGKESLIERVDALVDASKVPLGWGSPRLSTTPTSLAVRALAAQVEALERAVREIASEVQKLSAEG